MTENTDLRGMVRTPMGVGKIVARMREDGDGDQPISPIENTKYLVCLSRSNFIPEDWKKVSPGNGPCVFKEFEVSELSTMDQAMG